LRVVGCASLRRAAWLGSVDVDAHRPVAKSFGVRNVPFVTLLRHGAWFTWDADAQEPVPDAAARYEGVLAAATLAAWLNNRCSGARERETQA
jgi:hypothetical protein